MHSHLYLRKVDLKCRTVCLQLETFYKVMKNKKKIEQIFLEKLNNFMIVTKEKYIYIYFFQFLLLPQNINARFTIYILNNPL